MNNKALVAIIVILAIICGWLGYTVFSKEEVIQDNVVQLEEGDMERERLELDLMKMRMSYDTLYTDNASLSAEMDDQRAQIDDLLTKLKDRNWSLGKLKKEAGTLRDIMKGYVVTIDSLNTLNLELTAQRDNMLTRVENVEGENAVLKEQQGDMEKIISSGKTLQATGISATGIRLRNNGKQAETARASRMEMIKTCFDVMKNAISKPGNKTLYARIISPSGKVLPNKSGDGTGTFEGAEESFSVKRDIDYRNEQMAVCIFYEMPSEAEKGDYKIMLYENERLMGSANLTLN